jgi:ferredoxin
VLWSRKVFGNELFHLEVGKMAVHIDEDDCIGCGTCEELCPKVFKLDAGTEKAEVIMPEGGPQDLIEEAIESCPASCIYQDD